MIPGLCSIVARGSAGTSGGFSAAASPTFIYGGDGQTNIGPATAAPIGGTAPYTYAWVYQSGNELTLSAPAAAATGFDCGSLNPGDSLSSVYVCNVTDNIGRIAQTNAVYLGFSRSS
jgi:hypothetical protein